MMNDEEMLAEMRKHYPHATLRDHILYRGEIFLRCQVCRLKPVPVFGSVLWCDDCIDELLKEPEPRNISKFIEKKRSINKEEEKEVSRLLAIRIDSERAPGIVREISQAVTCGMFSEDTNEFLLKLLQELI